MESPLDVLAAGAEDNLLSRMLQAVELRCDEKPEWVELFSTRLAKGYKNALFESATRTVVGKMESTYADKKIHATAIITGNLENATITGESLLEIAKVFVDLVEELESAEKKLPKGSAKTDEPKKEDKRNHRGGMDILIGEDSDDLSKEFIGALNKDDPLTEKEMTEAIEAQVHGEHERRMLGDLKKMPVGKLTAAWTAHNGWPWTKSFIERLARTMLHANMKKYQGVQLDMGTFRRATDSGHWQNLARESAKDTSTLLFQQRRIENNVGGGGRGNRGGRGGDRGGRGGGRGMERGGTRDGGRGTGAQAGDMADAQAQFMNAQDGNGGQVTTDPKGTPAKDIKDRCRRCNSGDHLEADNGGCKQPYYCYNCNKNAGHIGRNCPEPQRKRGR